jgi:hypothetical protein
MFVARHLAEPIDPPPQTIDRAVHRTISPGDYSGKCAKAARRRLADVIAK